VRWQTSRQAIDIDSTKSTDGLLLETEIVESPVAALFGCTSQLGRDFSSFLGAVGWALSVWEYSLSSTGAVLITGAHGGGLEEGGKERGKERRDC